METRKPDLSVIADKYGINVKTVTRRIREHPELGITIEPRKSPVLTQNQYQGLCKILDEKYPVKQAFSSDSDLDKSKDVSSEFADLSQLVRELTAKNAELATDLAVANARLEEKDEQIGMLVAQTNELPKLLEASNEQTREIAELKGQVEKARDEWKSKGFMDRLFRR